MTKYEGLFGTIDLEPIKHTTSHKRRYSDYGSDWDETANTCLLLAHHICQDCGKNKAVNPHHIVPISKGGTNEQRNLKALCFHCHSLYHKHLRRKTDKALS